MLPRILFLFLLQLFGFATAGAFNSTSSLTNRERNPHVSMSAVSSVGFSSEPQLISNNAIEIFPQLIKKKPRVNPLIFP